MPQSLLSDVQNKVLRFLSPVTWTRLGIFAHLQSIYGIRVRLLDLRFMNVAMILAAYSGQSEVADSVIDSVQLARLQSNRHGANIRNRFSSRRPADNYVRAYQFFRIVAGCFPDSMIADVRYGTNSAQLGRQSVVRHLYRAMLARDTSGWREYLRQRLRARGWDCDLCLQGLFTLPGSVSQAHRWQLLRLHLNGI